MKIREGMTRENTALVIIDPINSCADETCESPEWGIHFSKIRQMLPKLNDFAKEYRKKVSGLVIVTTITPWTEEYLPENIRELYKDPNARYYSDDASGSESQFHTVEVSDTDFLITKNTYDIFSNDDLIQKLQEKGIRYLIMTGIFTDGCVLASIVSGFSKGYNFVILKDLVETTDLEVRQQLQKLLLEYTFPVQYGPTISSSELLEEMSSLHRLK